MGEDSRFASGRRYPGLTPELECDLLDRGGLGQVEGNVSAEEGGVDVDTGASEHECVLVHDDLDRRLALFVLLPGHVAFAKVLGVVGCVCGRGDVVRWSRRVVVAVGQRLEGSMQSGREEVLFCVPRWG